MNKRVAGGGQTIEFYKRPSERMPISRRELLKRGVVVGSSFLLGGSFVAASSGSWAMEVKGLEPKSMATLVQMARDIYPHDHFADALYAAAVKVHDEQAAEDGAFRAMIDSGITTLDQSAQQAGHRDYLSVGWEIDRVSILRGIESSEFFQTIRSGLVVGLYNQQAVWARLGYEGEAFNKGGYLERGFDDINWV